MRYPRIDASRYKLLIVEDSRSDAALLRAELKDGPLAASELTQVTTLAGAVEALEQHAYDAILLDLGLPDSDGYETFDSVSEAAGDAAIIVLTGLDDERVAEEAVRRGAQDYLVKGSLRSSEVSRAVFYSVRRQNLLTEMRAARDAQLAQKDQFLSHISHELRSPLSVVHQFASLLADGIAGPLNDEQADLLAVLMRNVDQLKLMIDDLLQVSHGQRNAVSIDVSVVAPATLLAEVLAAFEPVAHERGIKLVHEPRFAPNVLADPQRVQEVLANLIENALKFTPVGGTVTLSAEPAESVVRFVVRDTGCGIDPVALPHIFEQFFQAEQSDSVGRSGLGLGLFVCRDLVTRQGGEIRAQSRPGEGTTISFTLPAERQPADTEVPA